MNAPCISVLLPVYNARRYIGAAVESILGQTDGDFEFVIIDDGSTDGSTELLESFAAREPRIRLISRPNTGYVRALNEGLESCRGEFVARMDADDVAAPQRFERQRTYLQQHPECSVVGCAVEWIDSDGAKFCEQQMPLAHEAIESRLLQGLGALSHPGAMIRRTALVEAGGYREEFCGVEDHDLWLRLAERGRLANLPDVLLHGRVHAENFTFLNEQRNRELLAKVLQQAFQRRGLANPAEPLAALHPLATPLERTRSWAWSAVHAGHYRTARKHAWAVLRRRLLSRDSWVLFVYAVLGPRAETLRSVYRRLRRSAK
jgi:glycosyltransferase involved in cell wall biosynthesis